MFRLPALLGEDDPNLARGRGQALARPRVTSVPPHCAS
jgi:hypothetical protein